MRMIKDADGHGNADAAPDPWAGEWILIVAFCCFTSVSVCLKKANRDIFPILSATRLTLTIKFNEDIRNIVLIVIAFFGIYPVLIVMTLLER